MSKVVPIARKPALGLCVKRLEALDRFLAREVACGRIPGAVFRLALEGREIHCVAHGLQDPIKKISMRTESLFRTECMTKYATVLAVLRCCERGLLSLLDPVERFLPKFSDLRVLVGEGAETEPARKPILIKHLLTQTSGITYGQCGSENYRTYTEAGVAWNSRPDESVGSQDFVDRLAGLPLVFQPDARWQYGRNMEVLGRILEIVHDAPLGEVFQRELFEPLKIEDLFFEAPRSMSHLTAEPPPEEQLPKARLVSLCGPRGFPSGADGLIGAARGWGRLVDVAIGRGTIDGLTLLSPPTIDLMLSDQVGTLAAAEDFPLQEAYSYGLGVYVRIRRGPSTSPAGEGEFGWWGGWGTGFWGDPAYGLSGVLMLQFPDEARYYTETVKLLSYQAIIPI